MITVFIVGSSPSVRERLRRLLDLAELRVIGEGGDLAAAREAEGADVLVLGDDRPLDDLALDTGLAPQAVVLLAGFGMSQAVSHLSALGLRGWAVVPLAADRDELRAAVVAAAAGLAAIPADAIGADGSMPAEFGGRAEEGDPDLFEEPLTQRERQVLELLAHGGSNRDIAARLGISEHTAKFHVASVLAKLRAPNRADAVRRGIRRGLVTL